MKPVSSLFAKILSWFFLNLILVMAALSIFFAFQSQVNLHAIFGKRASDQLRATAMLIAHDLTRMPRENWPDSLSKHASIHPVDFTLVFEDGRHVSSTAGLRPPPAVLAKAREALGHRPPAHRFPPPHKPMDLQPVTENPTFGETGNVPNPRAIGKPPRIPPEPWDKRPHLTIRTQNPPRYWTGIRIPLYAEPLRRPTAAVLFAVSDSVTGNGFFFDPVPWMVVATAVIFISVLFWIPMVRNITRPLRRMTRATEKIAKGRFDVAIHETRSDEIGRLAQTINHMAERLSGFVNGQKRFLGDVAHELGSPVARIQFGLGALEQRIDSENRKRVSDVMEDVGHMSKLVNELLTFSRADLKSNTVKLERIDLLPVVKTAVKRETTPKARIIVRIDPGIRVAASAELLTRAVANLVRNAVKYAADEGPIEVTAEKRNGMVEIEVIDKGAGVPENLLDQLFEPFFRPEPSRDRDSGGVGLGLAIVKTCIETCGGTVSARNRQPGGFAVTITLNAYQAVEST